MREDTPQNQAPEQKIVRLEEGVVPPRLILPEEEKSMVPIRFIPPTVQQPTQTDPGQAPHQTTSTAQSTTTQQTQAPEQSQPSENK